MSKQSINTAGWDIGGAHVKLAYIDKGQLNVNQWECPLWKGVNELIHVLKQAAMQLPDTITRHNVTMTGELVDVFTSHDDGVQQIITIFIQNVAARDKVMFFSSLGLLECEQALNNKASVASANWLASAQLVATKTKNTVFIDIGSTTTDILHIDNDGLVLNGMTDFDRLITGELVYTGVVRSCVNTLCRVIPYNNNAVPLIAEYFSTTADVYRILEWLPAHADYGVTMDGRAKDKNSSMARLARMIGKDYSSDDEIEWLKVCEYLAEQQMLMIENNIKAIMTANCEVNNIVGAGVGAFLVKRIAERLSLNYCDFSKCVIPDDVEYAEIASDCAPAVSLVFINADLD